MTTGEEGDGEDPVERVQRYVLLPVVVLWCLTMVDSDKVRVRAGGLAVNRDQ